MRIVARGGIDLRKPDNLFNIKLAPFTVAIPTNADGTNPVLASAKTKLVVTYEGNPVPFSITGLIPVNCTATFSGDVVQLTGLSGESGEVMINFTIDNAPHSAVFTWTKAKQGNAGTDAYTVILNNESHSIPADVNGNVTAAELDKASSGISAWRGEVPLNSVAANATPGVGQYRYNITSTSGCTAVRLNDHSFKLTAMTADSAKVEVRVWVEGKQYLDKTMSISKAKAGQDGNAGAPGVQGPTLVPRGAYASNKTYVGTATNIDVVKFNDIWYKAKTNAGTFTGIAPTGHAQSAAKWETFGADFESIATDVFFAEKSTIVNLVATEIMVGGLPANPETAIGSIAQSWAEVAVGTAASDATAKANAAETAASTLANAADAKAQAVAEKIGPLPSGMTLIGVVNGVAYLKTDLINTDSLIAKKISTGTSGIRVEINKDGDGAMRAFNASGAQTFAVIDGKLSATDVDLTGKIKATTGEIGLLKIDNQGLYADSVGGYGSLKLTPSLFHLNYNALIDLGIVRSLKADYANTTVPLLELDNYKTGTGSANTIALSIRGGIQVRKGTGPNAQTFTAFTGSFQDYIGNSWRVENGLIIGYL